MTETTPDFEGAGGRAWRIDIRPADRISRDHDATVAAWHLHCPHAHPFWSWYVVYLIHLRDVPGQSKPPTKRYPEAAYEVVVAALDPEHPIQPAVVQRHRHLEPFDHVIQFHGTTDAQAVAVIELYVRACVEGTLSPDPDFRQIWRELMPQTIEHVVKGHHGP